MQGNKKMLVAIVSDEIICCQSLTDLLQRETVQIVIAHSGQDGLALIEDHPVDVAVLDADLTDIKSLELLKRLKAIAPDLVVILVADEATLDCKRVAYQQGADGFFIKPLLAEELFHVIHEFLEKRDLLQRVARRTSALLEEHKRLKQEIKWSKAQEVLVIQAKKEWERTVDAMPDMIAIVDKKHRIVRINKTMLDVLGGGYEDFVGKSCSFCIHGSEKSPNFCPHTLLLEDGKKHRAEIFEERLGGYCEIIVVPYRDRNGTLLGSVHIIRDINEEKRAAREKEKLHAQLLQAQKLEAVGQLASGIAHEINTPIQFVGTNIDFLKDAFRDISRVVDLLQTDISGLDEAAVARIATALRDMDWDYLVEEIPLAISQSEEGISRVSSLVRAMKEFSHPGSKTKEPADLNRILQTTITVARNEWKYVANVETDLDPGLPQIHCLVDEMGQVFLNILINAAHAIEQKLGSNPSVEKGLIHIQTRCVGSAVQVRIRDSGTGIPAYVQKRIFDPFFTTKEVGKGTGQGLAIARDVIVEKHGGTIGVESVSAEGTTFVIQLPRVDGEVL